MRGFRAAGAAVLLFALLSQSSGAGAPQEQPESPHFVPLRTYAPHEFQQSHRDSLSGGLTQRLPYRMAVDSQGRILVTDPLLSVVQVFDIEQGRRWQIKGDRDFRLDSPVYIAVDADDNLYVTEMRVPHVVVLRPSGDFLRVIGAGLLRLPTGIAVDKQRQRIYVADWVRGEILLFDLEGKLLQIIGKWGSGPGALLHPLDLALHGTTLAVLDWGNSRFEYFDLQGAFRGTWQFGANRSPVAFGIDKDGNLHYIDELSGGLVAMSPEGKVLADFRSRPFGQWVPRRTPPFFRCFTFDALGRVLALGHMFDIQVLELVSGPKEKEPPMLKDGRPQFP